MRREQKSAYTESLVRQSVTLELSVWSPTVRKQLLFVRICPRVVQARHINILHVCIYNIMVCKCIGASFAVSRHFCAFICVGVCVFFIIILYRIEYNYMRSEMHRRPIKNKKKPTFFYAVAHSTKSPR